MNRRSFLATPAALSIAAAEQAIAAGPEIPRRVFGRTGEKLTVIGQAGGRFGMTTFEQAKAVTRRAYELGVNYFDCARIYWNGRSEEVYGEALAGVRKNIFLTSKSPQRTRQGAEADLEKSLRALKTGYLDLWQIHQVGEMSEVEQIFAPGGAIEAFVAAKKAGKCRFIGFTGHHDPDVHLAMLKKFDAYDTILMPLNPADPHYLSFEQKVLPAAIERGLGIQAMKSTANAGLLGRIHVAECLGYVLSLPVCCVALGCTTVGQVEDDVRAAQQFRPLTAAEMQRLRDRAKGLAGPRLEDWKRDTDWRAAAPRHNDA